MVMSCVLMFSLLSLAAIWSRRASAILEPRYTRVGDGTFIAHRDNVGLLRVAHACSLRR